MAIATTKRDHENTPRPLDSSDEATNDRHMDKEIEQTAQRFERLADSLDPATAEVEGTDDLRDVATAAGKYCL